MYRSRRAVAAARRFSSPSPSPEKLPAPAAGYKLTHFAARSGRHKKGALRTRKRGGAGLYVGVELRSSHTETEEVRSWAPSYENYTFEAVPEGTRLVVDQDVTVDFEQYLKDTWPKALVRLKQLCEAG